MFRSFGDGRGGYRMQSHKWTWRGLLILAVAAPAGLFALDRPPPVPPRSPPPPPREVDLKRVYDALPEQYDLDRLGEWCALPPREATADEATTIQSGVLSAIEPAQEGRDPLMGRWKDDPARRAEVVRNVFLSPDRTRWVRLSDPADPNRWVGLVVRRHYNTAQYSHLIVFRVAVGF